MSTRTSKFIYLLVALSIVGVGSTSFAADMISSPFNITPVFLDQGNPVAKVSFTVTSGSSLLVDVAGPSDSFSVTLSDPGGQVVTPVLAYWSVRELGISGTKVGKRIGLSQSAVSRAVQRGEQLVAEHRLSLYDT